MWRVRICRFAPCPCTSPLHLRGKRRPTFDVLGAVIGLFISMPGCPGHRRVPRGACPDAGSVVVRSTIVSHRLRASAGAVPCLASRRAGLPSRRTSAARTRARSACQHASAWSFLRPGHAGIGLASDGSIIRVVLPIGLAVNCAGLLSACIRVVTRSVQRPSDVAIGRCDERAPLHD